MTADLLIQPFLIPFDVGDGETQSPNQFDKARTWKWNGELKNTVAEETTFEKQSFERQSIPKSAQTII